MPTSLLTRRRWTTQALARVGALCAVPGASWSQGSGAVVLRVGRRQPITTLAEAARRAQPGSIVEVQAGDYVGDVATWPQDDLSLRAVGGRVRVIAQGAHAQGKGLFVMTGQRQRIEGFDFVGTRVPDRNGAGIRLERGSLTLRDCRFHDNENGLLASNDPAITLDIEGCEFGRIAPGDGRTHNCYVGAIARLSVTGSWFHSGHTGHLLKSRAAVNHVFYNRLADGPGSASYELEFPNGGVAVVVGNLIEQGPSTQNFHLVGFGAEGLTHRRQALLMVNNTLIDRRAKGGVYLRVANGVERVRILNNLLAGKHELPPGPGWEQHHNHFVEPAAFAAYDAADYRLREGSPLRGRAVDAGDFDGLSLRLTREYHHPLRTAVLPAGTPLSPGAMQG